MLWKNYERNQEWYMWWECHIHKYHDKSSSEVKYCVANFKSNSKTGIMIEKEHEIDLQWIKILTHGNGNEGCFYDLSS